MHCAIAIFLLELEIKFDFLVKVFIRNSQQSICVPVNCSDNAFLAIT